MARIVVIGAGIAGAAAAYALRHHAVTVVEGSAEVGGKLRTSSLEGIDIDEGAEQMLTRVPEALNLVAAVGLGQRLVHPRTSQASVWSRGALRPLPARTVLGVPTSLRSTLGVLRPSEVLRAAADLVAPGEPPTGDVAVGAHLRRRLGDAVVDRLVDPFLGGIYAGRADDLSLFATMPQLRSDQVSVVRAARRALPPAGDERPVFAGLVGGLGALVAATLAGSGAEVLTRRAVRRIERTPGGLRVVHGSTTDEQSLDADAVVVAVPAAPAARLLADLVPAAAAELGAIDYASVAIISLHYPGGTELRAPGSGFLVPAIEGRAVKAATFSSAKWAHLDAGGGMVLRTSVGRAGDVAILQRDDADLVAIAARDLHEMVGLPATAAAARVSRWGGGLPQYAVGHLDRVARIRAAVGQIRGLAVCGAAYDGVGVPACIRSAQAAALVVEAGLSDAATRS